MKSFTPKERSEVDIRIEQEIKNHKDWMYQTTQQIQGISTGLSFLSAQRQKDNDQSFNERKSLFIAFENLETEVNKQIKSFIQRLGDIETKCADIEKCLESMLNHLPDLYLSKEEFSCRTADQRERLKELDFKINQKHQKCESQLEHLKSFIKEQDSQIRKSIPSIDEFKPLKKDMESSFQTFRVDFLGLIKEVSLIKKALAYDEKKFENVYTLIERLKVGQV